MDRLPIPRTNRGRILAVASVGFAIIFLVSFVLSSLELYRFQNWRDELTQEIASLEREKIGLLIEIERRQSPEWIEQAAADSGLVPQKDRIVRAVSPPTTIDDSSPIEQVAPQPLPIGPMHKEQPFDNTNWRGWRTLILGE